MSEESAKAFMEKAMEDNDLQEKLKGVDSEEKFFAVTKAAGFDFTKEEWLAVIPKKVEGELADADLEEAAGGIAIQPYRTNTNNKNNWRCMGECGAMGYPIL
ncbi:MAG: Nif11-like leader peptide family natural product precursor [Planctomycetota bacterium]|jgi:predicted ribosomally synthesized peptide with nif11-like leader|nr:Nif11-like leader peptide family natural product precursor [Planctomycetota bacterium]